MGIFETWVVFQLKWAKYHTVIIAN